MALRTAAIHGDSKSMKVVVFTIWMVSVLACSNFWEFGSPKSRLVTEHHNAIYSNFNHSWTKGWVYTNLFLSYQLTLKWWSSELGPPLSVNSSALRFALSLLYPLFNSSGASCVFYFNSSINTATIVGYASDCGIEILIWLLASIKIYKLGMVPCSSFTGMFGLTCWSYGWRIQSGLAYLQR